MFQTQAARVELRNSQGALTDGGSSYYYSGRLAPDWCDIGRRGDRRVTPGELQLPHELRFRERAEVAEHRDRSGSRVPDWTSRVRFQQLYRLLCRQAGGPLPIRWNCCPALTHSGSPGSRTRRSRSELVRSPPSTNGKSTASGNPSAGRRANSGQAQPVFLCFGFWRLSFGSMGCQAGTGPTRSARVSARPSV